MLERRTEDMSELLMANIFTALVGAIFGLAVVWLGFTVHAGLFSIDGAMGECCLRSNGSRRRIVGQICHRQRVWVTTRDQPKGDNSD